MDSSRGEASRLGPPERRAALATMQTTGFDVVVIGGGVTGCGAALDATTRGLSVALIEKNDFAAGTSGRSGKLIHGGLRYLETLNVGLVREALRERALMLGRLCPHLVKPVRFLYPLEHRVWERAYVGSGLVLYDTIGGAGAVPRHHHLTKAAALRVSPGLRPEGLAGAISFYDAQVDDARHTMTLARTARSYGAVVASQTEVVGLVRQGDAVRGVRVRDRLSGDEFEVRARAVVGAAGPWTEKVLALASRQTSLSVTASKGVHIPVPRHRLRSDAAILVRAEDSVLFIRPWGEHWLIGTTDTKWDGGPERVTASTEDVDYLLRNVNRVVSSELGFADVTGAYAGLRPLVSAVARTTSRLSREHEVTTPLPGLTVVAGGKYTTYRVMAADVIDAAVAGWSPPTAESCTAELPLLGAEGLAATWNGRQRLASASGLGLDRVERLVNRYGATSTELVDIVVLDPTLATPIPGAEGHLVVEASYAASHEGALHLEDILARRLRVTYETPDHGLRAATSVAGIVAPILGWDAATVATEVAGYRTWLAGEEGWSRPEAGDSRPVGSSR